MTRIFSTLSWIVVVLLIIINIQGFRIGDYQGIWQSRLEAVHSMQEGEGNVPDSRPGDGTDVASDQSFAVAQAKTRWHILASLFASLVSVLVNCLSVTYFIGTGRWCLEVVDAYGLDDDLVVQARKLKRRSFPWSLIGVLATIAMAALGAAADPSTLLANTQQWVKLHAIVSVAGTALVIVALALQRRYLGQNQHLIDRIVQEVQAARTERLQG